jgi:lipopolysaccharide/colanic/teichoic acid biosynthesis glycosyltransferase
LAGLTGDELEEAYVEKVLPVRLEYAQSYVNQQGIWLDFRILTLSLMRAFSA